ncbi:urease accessory protein UreF [Defluviimonas sp. 20V17]|uniref:Urease accessory protein UreF n=1 Tax=Allgaiera indica TaxID=765699 RepID=A0AAN4US66_9RHOB|nr:urease accessory UreF family protein [Allgaiera indica]KDB04601.1 urease accessory protein UreF [Defluviimonas sp. 20V17]GHE02587.1 urease accessory protein UreF [Allgaiera indica]SDX85515.1 urease accessory protein [Allgaiera indica]
MAADAGLLRLTQWLSPAFPLGGFAYSHGLEAAVTAGQVRGAGDLRQWVADVLREGAGRADAILLAQALAGADPGPLDDLARALASSRERLAETVEQGSALIRTINALTGAAHPPMALPVALGVVARGLDLPPAQVIALYLQAFAGNIVMAGVRFIPLGQTEGQAALAALHPVILAVAEEAAAAPLEALGGAAIGSDIAAMAHETLETRIFRT